MINRDQLNYRQSVTGVIVNQEEEILVVQKTIYSNNEWDFPGGGVERGETKQDAVIRELKEELGTDKFEVITMSETVDQYEWPDQVIEERMAKKKEVFRGQQRNQFLVKFTGDKEEIKLQPEEIRQIKWINPKQLAAVFIFPGQYEKAKKLLKEFGINDY